MAIGPREPGRVPANPAVLVQLTADDYLAVAELAEREGLAMASFVRMLVRRQIESAKAAQAVLVG